jgi:hypothetical protein
MTPGAAKPSRTSPASGRATARKADSTVQAWIEPVADDADAVTAFHVARSRMGVRGLESLRRFRVVEIAGTKASLEEAAARLHGSTQFYNPHKERCRVRSAAKQASPVESTETLVLVWERDGERRPAAERWWRHESGEAVEVREGVVWAMRFAAGIDAAAAARDLALVRDAGKGLLCNPWSQESRFATGGVPVPWIAPGKGE